MDIVVRDTPRDAAEWDRLVDAAPIPTPFARSWWLEAWSGPASRIIHVTDGPELVGGLALQSERKMGIDRVGLLGHDLAPDHCDLLARKGAEAKVGQAVAEWFAGSGQRYIALDGVAGGAALLGALPANMTTSVLDKAPCQPLPADFATYLQGRHRMFRKNISRYRRQMSDRGLRHGVIEAHDVEFMLAELRRLHASVFGAASSFLPHFETFARAARLGIRKGEVVFHAALDGDRAVGVEAVFEVGGRVSTYQGGRDADDPRSSGLSGVLLSYAVEQAIERGCRELDMLRGDQPYKRDWTDGDRDILAVRATSGAIATSALHTVHALRAAKRWTVAQRRPLRRAA